MTTLLAGIFLLIVIFSPTILIATFTLNTVAKDFYQQLNMYYAALSYLIVQVLFIVIADLLATNTIVKKAEK
jgi:hypothetical protein